MSKIKAFTIELKTHKIIYLILVSVIILGIFLRVYKHAELLHFELDQARDVFVVYDMLNDGNIPLLGPYARGSELYLGPIFYYFQAIPAFFFGTFPSIVAWPDLIFSILFLPLFYFFARLYFSREVSVMITALAATSLFLVTYGRFAWNPNALPFWMTLAMYGLLRAWNNKVFSLRWFLVMVGASAVVMQLHFVAFLTVPLIVVSYMIFVRMRLTWKPIFLSIGLLCLLFTPIIVSEFQTSGANTKSFFATIVDKGDKDDSHNIIEKIFRGIQETATYNLVLLTSNQSGGDNIRTKKTADSYFLCDSDCRGQLPVHIVAMSIFAIISIVFLYQFIQQWKRCKENITNNNIYQRYLLIILWLLWSGVFLVLMAYQISPRFYLLIVPAFLVMFGTVLQLLQKRFGRVGKYVSIGIVSLLIIFNLVSTWQYFSILNNVLCNVETHCNASLREDWRDLIMNRNDYITLGQLRGVAHYIGKQGGESKFFIVGDNRYARALYFLTNIENNISNAQCYIKRSNFETKQVEGREYYVLVRTKSKTHVNDEMLVNHDITDEKSFGTVTLYRMVPKNMNNNITEIPKGCFVR